MIMNIIAFASLIVSVIAICISAYYMHKSSLCALEISHKKLQLKVMKRYNKFYNQITSNIPYSNVHISYFNDAYCEICTGFSDIVSESADHLVELIYKHCRWRIADETKINFNDKFVFDDIDNVLHKMMIFEIKNVNKKCPMAYKEKIKKLFNKLTYLESMG